MTFWVVIGTVAITAGLVTLGHFLYGVPGALAGGAVGLVGGRYVVRAFLGPWTPIPDPPDRPPV